MVPLSSPPGVELKLQKLLFYVLAYLHEFPVVRGLQHRFINIGLPKMAPTRRYLRITKHSVLEVRIYLERPSDSEGWLLRRDNPALPRVIEAVRPLVLPKLREENERASGRAGGRGKKKGVKDVVVGGMFIFTLRRCWALGAFSEQKKFINYFDTNRTKR